MEKIIHKQFEKVVNKYPEQIAINDASGILTYSTLNSRANQLAYSIAEQTGNRREPVVFLLEHGSCQMVAMMGILKSGNFYIPLDPEFPLVHLKAMLVDSGTEIIVTNNINANFTIDTCIEFKETVIVGWTFKIGRQNHQCIRTSPF